MATAETVDQKVGGHVFPLSSGQTDDEQFWDATTAWDMTIEVPARLIEYVDNNIKARKPHMVPNLSL